MMRSILGTMVTVALATGPGCVVTSDDDDDYVDPGGDYDPDDRVDLGYFTATWTLTSTYGDPLSCYALGADGVSFVFTDSYGDAVDEIFSCADMANYTDPLERDDYTLSVSLLDAYDRVLGQSVALGPQDGVTLLSCDYVDASDYCVTELPNINFVF